MNKRKDFYEKAMRVRRKFLCIFLEFLRLKVCRLSKKIVKTTHSIILEV